MSFPPDEAHEPKESFFPARTSDFYRVYAGKHSLSRSGHRRSSSAYPTSSRRLSISRQGEGRPVSLGAKDSAGRLSISHSGQRYEGSGHGNPARRLSISQPGGRLDSLSAADSAGRLSISRPEQHRSIPDNENSAGRLSISRPENRRDSLSSSNSAEQVSSSRSVDKSSVSRPERRIDSLGYSRARAWMSSSGDIIHSLDENHKDSNLRVRASRTWPGPEEEVVTMEHNPNFRGIDLDSPNSPITISTCRRTEGLEGFPAMTSTNTFRSDSRTRATTLRHKAKKPIPMSRVWSPIVSFRQTPRERERASTEHVHAEAPSS